MACNPSGGGVSVSTAGDFSSKVGTVFLATAPATNIGPFYVAPATTIVRLFIRNTGPGLAILAFDSSVVNNAGTLQGSSERFLLTTGQDIEVILEPRQGIYAVGIGAGGVLSYHSSRPFAYIQQG